MRTPSIDWTWAMRGMACPLSAWWFPMRRRSRAELSEGCHRADRRACARCWQWGNRVVTATVATLETHIQNAANLSLGGAMGTYRHALPQLSDRVTLTDGGIETTLIYHEGIELPYFAAFVLLDDDAGLPVVVESPTWRASRDWGRLLGYDGDGLAEVNRRAVELLAQLRGDYATV